jgi:hypothetical protein
MKRSMAEAITNSTLGLAVSWLITWAVLGFTPVQSIGITLLFFAVSTARNFIVREAFRRING